LAKRTQFVAVISDTWPFAVLSIDPDEGQARGTSPQPAYRVGLRPYLDRPIATLSVEAQERHEKREKVYRDE
jgi:hypothetical protein